MFKYAHRRGIPLIVSTCIVFGAVVGGSSLSFPDSAFCETENHVELKDENLNTVKGKKEKTKDAETTRVNVVENSRIMKFSWLPFLRVIPF